MLVKWILNSINASLRKTIPYFEEARPLWDLLRRRFNVSNSQQKQKIKKALAEYRQPKNMSLAEYFGMLQPLWDALATYNPIPACRCGKCDCDLRDVLQARFDEECCHDFLYDINEKLFTHLRSSLLALTSSTYP
ncbi:hypothetical protein LIER_20144 [Lithospermum erythrorhizon]|uniref:Retrotransposon gag domain-containing protein n=1 Tax=Lithospermum erythrorhizon TaxID=34254 RepID=A0AAV3QNG3_LITER